MASPEPGESTKTSDHFALDEFVTNAFSPTSPHSPSLQNLASIIMFNLQYQHDWTNLTIHSFSDDTTQSPLPRPLISGLPPKRIYVHPDEQVEILKSQHQSGSEIAQRPEREWVLPTHLTEKLSLKSFATIFDSVGPAPPGDDLAADGNEDSEVGKQWRGIHRQKRILLATLHDDSTVVYYIVHDGLVKPRQN